MWRVDNTGGALGRPLQQERKEDGGGDVTVFLQVIYCVGHQPGGQVEVKIKRIHGGTLKAY